MFELFTTNKGYLHKLEGFEYVEKAKSEIIQEQKALRLVFLFQFFQFLKLFFHLVFTNDIFWKAHGHVFLI